MNEIVKIDPKDFGLDKKKADEIKSGLGTILKEREILKDAYIDVLELDVTEETIPTFKELRLQIVKNRTKGLNVWHKTNKAYFLAGGNFVQAIYNKEVAENERMESALMDAEKHFENIEKERIAKLETERNAELLKYDPEMTVPGLGGMDESVWKNFIQGIKLSFEQRKSEAEKAEAERLRLIEVENEEARLKAIEDERIRKENARLIEEAKEKEAKIEARNTELMPYIVFIRDYNTLLNSNDSEYKKQFNDIKKGAELQWKSDREAEVEKQKEEKRLIKEANDNKEKRRMNAIQFLFDNGFENAHGGMSHIEYSHFIGANHYSTLDTDNEYELFTKEVLSSNEANEAKIKSQDAINKLKVKEDAELKAKKEAEKAAKLAAQAPDKDKLIKSINEMVFIDSEFKTVEAEAVYNVINQKFEAFKVWAISQTKSL